MAEPCMYKNTFVYYIFHNTLGHFKCRITVIISVIVSVQPACSTQTSKSILYVIWIRYIVHCTDGDRARGYNFLLNTDVTICIFKSWTISKADRTMFLLLYVFHWKSKSTIRAGFVYNCLYPLILKAITCGKILCVCVCDANGRMENPPV